MSPWSVLSIVAGVALLGFALLDLFGTVFMISGGAGPQSRRLADRAWRLALRLHDPGSDKSHSLLRAAGPAIVLLVVLVWVAEFTLAWTLVFVPDAFTSPADLSFEDRFTFAAQAVSGRGGNRPQVETADGAWEVVHWLSGLTGVTLVSLGLAYVLPVIASVAHKRSIAAMVHALGDSVDEMRAVAARAGGGSFELHLIALAPQISWSAERHRAYPVLHYFHSRDRHAALAPAIAKLVLLVEDGMPQCPAVDATVTVPLGRSVRNLLGALADMGLGDYAETAEGVDPETLERTRLDPDNDAAAGALPDVDVVRAYVGFDGWDWAEVEEGNRNTTARRPAGRPAA